MKQNGFWKGFGSGLVLTVLIAALCVTATATSKRSIQVEDGIGITLNGARFTPRDAAGKQVPVFLYNGTTYVPVRAISEAMGMDVSFNSATRTVQLTTADRTVRPGPAPPRDRPRQPAGRLFRLRQLYQCRPGQADRPE